jgi:hypothetical protein
MQPKVLLTSLLLAVSVALAAPETTLPTNPVLSLNEHAPTLVLPGDGWTLHREQRNRSKTGIYYLLSNGERKVYLSTYIEKTEACGVAEDCLKLSFKNESYNKAEGRVDFESTIFKASRFFVDEPQGLPIKQVHILASAYIGGYWIDIHLSAAGPERPSVDPLQTVLESLSVRSAP